jgi:hypothetical protein
MSVFDVLGTVGKLALPSFLKFWACGKPSLGSSNMVPRTEAAEAFLARRRAFFRSRFQLERGKSWRSESCRSCLNMSSFLHTWACGSHYSESEKIFARARHPRGGKCEISCIVIFLPSVFARTVDVVPDVGFW